MKDYLFSANTPQTFWQVQEDLPPALWQTAIQAALPELGLAAKDIDTAIQLSLGEGQFGPDHWHLGFAKRIYYLLKPLLPRPITRIMRKIYSDSGQANFPLGWPVEERYAAFLWACLRQLLILNHSGTLKMVSLWPESHQAAFILTHDIETSIGQKFALRVAELEVKHGFRSSFNFVPQRYKLDQGVIAELRNRGFEIGVHGLKHDGKLFLSQEKFNQRAEKINHHLHSLKATGFRTPLTHRNPLWMQKLEIEYDLSFFDTDPYEPIPGGTMSLWPFQMGHFMELPYTLPQDYTLVNILKATTPAVWLDKVDFLKKYHAMALLNTHPDYLRQPANWAVYESFLEEMAGRSGFWHTLPRQAAAWWRKRQTSPAGLPQSRACLENDQIIIEPYRSEES